MRSSGRADKVIGPRPFSLKLMDDRIGIMSLLWTLMDIDSSTSAPSNRIKAMTE